MLILTLAILTQSPITVRDVEFERIVLDNIIQFRKSAKPDIPTSVNEFLNSRDATLLRMLNAQEYEFRKFAKNEINKRGKDAIQIWVLGTRSTDKMIKHTCETVLSSYYTCKECDGYGSTTTIYANKVYWYNCVQCGGTGKIKDEDVFPGWKLRNTDTSFYK